MVGRQQGLGIVVVLAALAVLGGPAAVAPVVAARGGDGASGAAGLAEVVDGLVARQVGTPGVPGAAVGVVEDGEVTLARGRGVADAAEGRGVAADTPFRVMSVSKVVVWTAVLQQVERGALDLDVDVARYLDEIEIPDAFGAPVTLGQLMAHTAGFEEPSGAATVRDGDPAPDLAGVLADVPRRILPPGAVTAYSNYGTALAALVVQDVTGVPFGEYTRTEVFAPLGMTRTAFGAHLPPELRGQEARPHIGVDEEALSYGVREWPAGGVWSTGADMAAFAAALLGTAPPGRRPVLGPSSLALVQQVLHTNADGLDGITHGLFEFRRGTGRMLHHEGDGPGGHAGLYLFPERRAAVFVAYNGEGGAQAREELRAAVVDRLLPAAAIVGADPASATAPPLGTPEERRERARGYAGEYLDTRRDETGVLRVNGLLSPQVTVAAEDDGTVTISGGDGSTRWVEIAPGVLRALDGARPFLSVFRHDAAGGHTYLLRSDQPFTALDRVSALDSQALHFAVDAAAVVLFLSAWLAWPVAELVRRRRGRPRPSPAARWARAVAGATSVLLVLAPVGVVAALMAGAGQDEALPPLLVGAFVVGLAGTAGAVGTAVLAVRAWTAGWWGAASRVHFTAVALGTVALTASLWRWNVVALPFG